MAESPLARLSRLLGGVVLTHGRFPHQVLGQLLIADSNSVELAGANMAIVASSGHRSALADAAVRTAAPAIAIQILAQKQEARLRRLATIAETSVQRLEIERDRIRNERLKQERTFNRTEETLLTLDDRERELAIRAERLDARDAELDALFESRVLELEARARALEERERELEARERALADSLAQREPPRAEPEPPRAEPEPPRAEPKPKPTPKPAKKSRSKKKPSGGPK
jgi:hypothetical protein